ncbi:MAG: hypothetical protein IJK60_06885 [Clostridia bacterium]|nr:hypothetical protein [Clostridia bacterium]
MKFNLLPDESVILKSESVCYGNFGAYTNDLYLTDKAIVLVRKGLFGNIKGEVRFPLNEIKIYKGKPQTLLVKKPNGLVQIDVYLRDSIETFGFSNNTGINNAKKQASLWINTIYKTITGRTMPDSDEYDEEDRDDTLIGIFKEIGRDVIGIQPKKKNHLKKEMVSKKCNSCSASLSGYKGEIVHCEFCDTDQVL